MWRTPSASVSKVSWVAWVPWRPAKAKRKTATVSRRTEGQLLTDPAEAADFVAKTKVDALAIAIGTSHGAYKFTRKPRVKCWATGRIAEIHKAIPNTLVMHGSSSVPQEWLEMINKYGGQIPEPTAFVEEIQEGIRNGVRKVNIDTDNRWPSPLPCVGRCSRSGQLRPPPLQQACAEIHEAGLPRPLPAVLGRRQQQDQAARHQLLRRSLPRVPLIPRLPLQPDPGPSHL